MGLATPARLAAALVRLAEPRRVLSWSSRAIDTAIAAVATLVSVAATIVQARDGGGSGSVLIAVPGSPPHVLRLGAPTPVPSVWVLLAVALTAAPLAFRRRYPITAFCVILTAVLVTRSHATVLTFAVTIFAAYGAVVYSEFRRTALLAVFTGAVIVTAAFPNTTPPVPARFTAFLVLMPTAAVAVAMRRWRERAGDSAERLRRAQAEHEDQTRRAVEAERARIAGELHDVVTHNVSVMVVQAGAARRVLDISPDDAREALLAVEASGRTAMTELRHLLGLLAPAGSGEGEAALLPQPRLGQVRSLVDRVRGAGLPVELTVTGERTLPPGADLAAYRVVQEALTNVLKHAGQARTSVRIEYLPRALRITVTDDGRPEGAPATGGRGLIGLRERIAVYHGTLDVGPRPGGGWRLVATIPLEDAVAEQSAPVRAAAP
jgi:signal transduction histidine kinase